MSFSIVPGFAQRYPRYDEDPHWHDEWVIESCCTGIEEARAAQWHGADRIELCTDLSVGGITPSRELIQGVVEALTIPVNVLVRPAACLDFVYGEEEIRQMAADIDYCKSVGAAGVVAGALTPEGGIDMNAMRRLVAAAKPLPVTFHRAFDVCTEDPFEALEKIISLGCTRLLTSGMAENAWEGRDLIAQLVQRAGDRLIILAGRGVTPQNVKSLATVTGAREFNGTQLP